MRNHPLATRRQFLQLLGIGAGTVLVQGGLSGCAVDPVTGRSELMLMTPAEEIALDREQSPYQFSADYGPVQDRALNAYINRVGQELAARSHRPEMPFSFRAVNATYINAYAFPGGSIAATRGILLELDNEAELAALLGHEIGHVNARHTAKQATKGTIAGILLSGATIAAGTAGYAGFGGLIRDLGGLGAGALLAHYSRDNEREADALGTEYMTRAGYTPRGMVGLMKILLQNGRANPSAIELMFSTHPMSEERYKTAQQYAGGKYKEMLSAPDHRERYQDNTAGLRRIKGAITAMQDGTAAMGREEFGQAEQQFNRALKIAPNDYAALVMMAKCKMAQEKIREAEAYGQQATKVYPQEAQAHVITGLCGIINKRYDTAYNHLNTYDRLLPGNPEIAFFQGLAREGMGRRKEAARYYYSYLQEVRRGDRARYAYARLKKWGYLR